MAWTAATLGLVTAGCTSSGTSSPTSVRPEESAVASEVATRVPASTDSSVVTSTTTVPETAATQTSLPREVSWAITVQGWQTVTWDVSGQSAANPTCYASYHHWGSTRIDFETSAPAMVKIPAELTDEYDGELSPMHEHFALGPNEFASSGPACTNSASTPPCELDQSLPAVLVIENETVTLRDSDWRAATANGGSCSPPIEHLLPVAPAVAMEQLLGDQPFTAHGETMASLPMDQTYGTLVDEAASVSVTTSWDITFSPTSG